MGCPIKRLIAATNANDTVPRYLKEGKWSPNPTIPTITNAMDVAQPNNFIRVQYLSRQYGLKFNEAIHSVAITEEQTKAAMRSLAKRGYFVDPHTALAMYAVKHIARVGILGTAHPAKFADVLQKEQIHIELPKEIERVKDKVVLSLDMKPDYEELKNFLLYF